MYVADWNGPLGAAHEAALDFLEGLPPRPVGAAAGRARLLTALGGPVPEHGVDARTVVAQLARDADPGIVATPSGRFFDFVIGGSVPAALGADWLVSTWDQNAGIFAISPAAGVIEEVTGGWLRDLLALPSNVSFGFVTGAQAANTTALAAARHEVLRRVGWNVATDGLPGAPPVRVLAGRDRHDTIDRALRLLGMGTNCIEVVDTDDSGRMLADDLSGRIDTGDPGAPTIVCAQAGGVNTGAVDPLARITQIGHDAGAWVHVDGAFGMWAATSPHLASILDGAAEADSWTTDAHKWLNVPYDCGLVFTAHPEAHRAAMSVRAAYLVHAEGPERDEMDWNLEFSRRARAIPVYAAIRSLGRVGIADIVERGCAMAQRFADGLATIPGAEVLAEVTLNQVLVRFLAPDGGDDDAWTRGVVNRLRADGTAWFSGTTWRGAAAMRISVTNWSTDEADVDAALDVIAKEASGPPK